MLNYYQPFLLPFLGFKRSKASGEIFRSYFISFEDILWNLLSSRNIPKQSNILIPDFYCMDVVNNIRLHGYTPVFYPLDDHFQIQKKIFEKFRKKYNPSVIIFFHACGIRNILTSDTKFIQKISENTLVIEDSVHLLLNPEKVKSVHDNHVIIDSIRKTSPLNGSFIYSRKKLKHAPKYLELQYQILSNILFILFRLTLQLGTLFKSPSIISFAHKTILKCHDDLIGDSAYGHRGNPITAFLYTFIQFSRVEKLKIEQTEYYSKWIFPKPFYAINIAAIEYKNLHVFPVGVNRNSLLKTEELEEYLASRGIPVWFKYPDCPWSKYRSVLFLPLGFHVRYNEITQICTMLGEFTKSIHVS